MTPAKKVKIGLAVALSVIIFILVIQNTQPVRLRVIFWDLTMSLVLLIPFVFLLGMVVGYILRRR